jgi:hypothetical protein
MNRTHETELLVSGQQHRNKFVFELFELSAATRLKRMLCRIFSGEQNLAALSRFFSRPRAVVPTKCPAFSRAFI